MQVARIPQRPPGIVGLVLHRPVELGNPHRRLVDHPDRRPLAERHRKERVQRFVRGDMLVGVLEFEGVLAPEPEEHVQGNADARPRRVVPGHLEDESFRVELLRPVVGDPEAGDPAGALEVRQHEFPPRLERPEVRVSPLGIDGGHPPPVESRPVINRPRPAIPGASNQEKKKKRKKSHVRNPGEGRDWTAPLACALRPGLSGPTSNGDLHSPQGARLSTGRGPVTQGGRRVPCARGRRW